MSNVNKRPLSKLKNVIKPSALVKKVRTEERKEIVEKELFTKFGCKPFSLNIPNLTRQQVIQLGGKFERKRQLTSQRPKYKCNICYKNPPLYNCHIWRHVDTFHKTDCRWEGTNLLRNKKAIQTPLFARLDLWMQDHDQAHDCDANGIFVEDEGESDENDENTSNTVNQS